MQDYETYRRALTDVPLPAAFVDLDALAANVGTVRERAAGVPVRVASKSVRCRAVLDRVTDADGIRGLMGRASSDGVVELVGERDLPAGVGPLPGDRRGDPAGGPERRPRGHGPGGRRGPLVPAGRHERRRARLAGAVHRPRRDGPRRGDGDGPRGDDHPRPEPRARRARPRPEEHGRHRQAGDRRRDQHRHARGHHRGHPVGPRGVHAGGTRLHGPRRRGAGGPGPPPARERPLRVLVVPAHGHRVGEDAERGRRRGGRPDAGLGGAHRERRLGGPLPARDATARRRDPRTEPRHRRDVRRVPRGRPLARDLPDDAVRAFEDLRRTVEGSHRVQFPVEFRTVAGDYLPLSPAYGRESAFLACHRYHRKPYREFLEHCARTLEPYDARPHWGKHHRRWPAPDQTDYGA